jgi:hypothetical protein
MWITLALLGGSVMALGMWLPGVQVVESGMAVDDDMDVLEICLNEPDRWQSWGVRPALAGRQTWQEGDELWWQTEGGDRTHWTLMSSDWQEGMVFSSGQTTWVLTLDEDEGWLSLVEERDVGFWPWQRIWWFFRRSERQAALRQVLHRLLKGCRATTGPGMSSP